MLILSLALRDLLRDRFFLICNIAVMVGILVPLLVLFGVKNGVYSALIGEMLADPASRQIDTRGNAALTEADLAPLRDWPEIVFLTPKVRGQFDYMTVRPPGARRARPALVVPSGTGDPTLPEGLSLAGQAVAVSAQLASQLDLQSGQEIQLVSQAEGRARQLVLTARIASVLPESALSGRTVLAPFEMLDLIEAFYESYSLPDHGIFGTRDLADRVPSYEGVRLYVDRLEHLAAVQVRLERELGIGTIARTREVEALLGLGRNLGLALGLTTALAALGLGAALMLGFWSEVGRKKTTLAGLALMGLTAGRLALIPMVQGLVTAVLGLVLSFALYGVAATVAADLFGQGLPGSATLTILTLPQAVAISGAVIVLVLAAAGLAAWIAQRVDPASILREGA